MKVFISSDIEGTNGICAWEETDKPKAAYPFFMEQMSREVAAACEGVNLADPGSQILVKDAHDSARNIDHNLLPRNAKLIRGWAASPYSMMYGIDGSFDAALFTGYHSAGGTNGTPLAHTMSYSGLFRVTINGRTASEFLINYYAALYNKVPVIMVTGDAQLCETVKAVDPNIATVAVNTGAGGSVLAEHPALTLERIRDAAKAALESRAKVSLHFPKSFETRITYRSHIAATRASFYPGAYAVDADTVGFDTEDYFEFLRFFMFT